MKMNEAHQKAEIQNSQNHGHQQFQRRQAYQSEKNNSFLVENSFPDSLDQQLNKLEDERKQLLDIIRDRDFYIANLKKQSKYLQSEVFRQSNYIQHVDNANDELNKILTDISQDLKGIQDARSTRILKALRSFSLKKLFAAFSRLTIDGNLDSPEGCEITSGTLAIAGWAFTETGTINKVEAFLGEVKLGEIQYGVVRPDVLISRPLQKTVDCGFAATLCFQPVTVGTGAKIFKVKVSDNKGRQREFTRLVIVELAKNLPANVISLDEANSSSLSLAVEESQNAAYLTWIVENEPSPSELTEQRQNSALWNYRPLISIGIQVYDASPVLLRTAIESVLNQSYENWELCLLDDVSENREIKNIINHYAYRDHRVRIKVLDINRGNAGNSNEAIKMAKGEFVGFLNPHDELAANALYENVLSLNQHKDADMIYSDEDKLNAQDFRCEPYFKPDWSPDLFYSTMYTCNLGVYRKSLIDQIGGFREGFNDAQEYDLVLRLIEQTDRIYHIPKILYHQRKAEYVTPLNLSAKDSQIKAVTEHFQRRSIKAEVSSGLVDNLLRVKRELSIQPKVSIIIPTKDQFDLLRNCIESIQKRDTYHNYEIIIVNNNSSDSDTLQYLKDISKEPEISVIEYRQPFNFAAINNFAADYAKGELLLFLNDDTEVISHEWLEAMVEHAVRPEVGAVGARLLYSNGLVQHAGVIIGIGGVAGHSHKLYPSDHPGYFSRAKAIQNLSAVTAACMMVRKSVFKSLGGFDEKNLAIAYNDIDFCLRIRRENLLVVYTPYAELYHYESASRGSDEAPKQTVRFQQEGKYMLDNWKEVLRVDPYYNPNLTLSREDFSIADVVKRLKAE